jgi:hypothetical protein
VGERWPLPLSKPEELSFIFLLGLDSVHIFPIHPKSLKSYRDALHPSGAKDDPTEAELLLQFLTLHKNRIKPWIPNEPEIRLLLRLVECRRKIVGKRIRLTNPFDLQV